MANCAFKAGITRIALQRAFEQRFGVRVLLLLDQQLGQSAGGRRCQAGRRRRAACQQALVGGLRQFQIAVGFGDLSGQQQVSWGFRAELERRHQSIPGGGRIAAAVQLRQRAEGLCLGCGVRRLRGQQRRLLHLFPGLIVLALVRQQKPKRQASLELFRVRGDGLAVVGGGRIFMAAGILNIAKVKERAGIGRMFGSGTSTSKRARALEILLLYLAFGRVPLRTAPAMAGIDRAPSGAWVPGGS